MAAINVACSFPDWDDQEHNLSRHTVAIGDICFVAIGEIANRDYMAVRYQPTGCIVVNSPVRDKALAAELRAIWGTSEHRQNPARFAPPRLPNDSGVPSGGAMRLAYYFPDAAEDLIVARLHELLAATAIAPREDAVGEGSQA